MTRAAPAALLLALSVVAVGDAQAGSITIAWDASSDPSVAGYRIYVGTESGVYTQSFDSGGGRTFVYEAAEFRPYYFAVASYTPDGTVGPLSPEVSGTPFGGWPVEPVTPAFPDPDPLATPGFGGPGDRTSGAPDGWWASPGYWYLPYERRVSTTRATCWETDAGECLTVELLAASTPTLASLAPAHDGRLFFIEDRRRVRVLAWDAPAGEAVLAAERGVALTQVALHPGFAANGFIYVGETAPRADGRRDFGIFRYRLVQNRAGERAPIVTGIPLSAAADAPFAVTADGDIYLATPGIRGSQRDAAYAGAVLRFAADGTTPADSRSPILATGHPVPTAMAADGAARAVWVAGLQADSSPVLSRVAPADVSRHAWGAAPAALRMRTGITSLAVGAAGPDGSRELFAVSVGGRLERARIDATGAIRSVASLDLTTYGTPTAVAAGAHGEIYVVVRTNGGSNGGHALMLRLVPRR